MKKGPKDAKAVSIPTGPQSVGSAIPPDVVKQTVDTAIEKQPVISAAAQQELEAQKKKNEEAERVAKENAKANEAHFDALKSDEEKESARKLLEAKEKHRAQAAEEVRLQMLAEKQAAGNANVLGAQAVEIAQKIQPDVSARAEAANKEREDKIAAEEALAKQHALEEKEHKAKVEAEKTAKAARLAELKNPKGRKKPAPTVDLAPVATVVPVVVAQKELEIEQPNPAVESSVPSSIPTPAVAAPVSTIEQARQQAELNAENARKEINRKIANNNLLNQAILSISLGASSLAIYKLGVVFAAPLSLTFVAALIVGTVLYFAIPKLKNAMQSAYQGFKFTDQQRFQHVLDNNLKLNVSLERQLNPITQKSLLSKLDKLAANVPNPTFDGQGKIITFPECNQLTVVSWENHKLFKRATKNAAARTKWDEKFAARDEKDIYVKITNKVKG